MGIKLQRELEHQLDKSLQLLNPDNQVFGLADAVEGPYTDLVEQLLGPELWDWLLWWIYETDWGTKPMQFTIHEAEHNPTEMTLYRFLEIVDEND